MSNGRTLFKIYHDIRASVTMEQVLDHYHLLQTLEQNGNCLSGACPIHKGADRTCFRVDITKNIWVCSKCVNGGTVLDFVRLQESVPLKWAAFLISVWFELPQQYVLQAQCLPLTTI